MADLLLRGGNVYDGLGNPPNKADIAVTGDRITAIGDLAGEQSGVTYDISGFTVSPGFIDIHTHSDFALLDNPLMESSLTQGVTTEVVGNCGMSIGMVTTDPVFSMEARWIERSGRQVSWNGLAEYLRLVAENGIGLNVFTLIGHGTVRKAVLGFENRPPDAAELVRMQRLVQEAMDAGAVGISTGLEYVPGAFAGFDEQASLVSVAASAGGFYATHLRNEGDTLVESVQEAINIAEAAHAPLQLSHHKAEGRQNWSKIDTTIAMMDEARARGMDVLTDLYPYTAFMTGLSVILLPPWAMEGDSAATVKRLKDPAARARILADIAQREIDWTIISVGIARNRSEVQGLTLAALGMKENKTPAEAAIDLIVDEDGWVTAAHFAMSEANVEQILRYPFAMIGSDGVAHDPGGPQSKENTHPRSYGTFSRLLGRYARDRNVIPLADAIRRMTSLPANRLRLTDRGVLRVGAIADISVFDADRIVDQATFENPHQYSTGIEHVVINGRMALENGIPKAARNGRVLLRPT